MESVDIESGSSYDGVPRQPPKGAMEAVLLIQALIIFALLNKFVL